MISLQAGSSVFSFSPPMQNPPLRLPQTKRRLVYEALSGGILFTLRSLRIPPQEFFYFSRRVEEIAEGLVEI